jgi:UDP-2-acetamido-2-deoxy-ribo-hexuluronate aminotransferase
VHYPIPLNLQPVFAAAGPPAGVLGVAEEAARRVVSLPMHPYLGEDDLQRVADAVAACLDAGR